tara:strand:- start:627 stop:890 length:264 start_codon:yes stop_codon:yes gene_type:complete
MEKIIFFGLVIPIFMFVLFLGGRAIMTGFSAKSSKDSNFDESNTNTTVSEEKLDNLSAELNKLNDLLKSGVLTQEEFDKAKKKILDD